jgi:DNA-directed RNA polymerase specialized sigma24 family protein
MAGIEAALLRLTKIGLLALGGACRLADIIRPSAQPKPAMYAVQLESALDTSPATRPPDVVTAKAAEAAALDRIANHLPPDRREQFLARLLEHRPLTISYIASTSDRELSALISAY